MITSTPPPGHARLTHVFATGRAEHRAALGLYMPVGYPTRTISRDTLRLMANYANVIELGIPYTNPQFDGPVIQNAAQQALRAGFRMLDLFTTAADLAMHSSTAILAVSYWAPIEQYGPKAFAAQFAAAGGAGVRILDLPDTAATAWQATTRMAGLHAIGLAPPHATSARLAQIGATTSGMIYARATPGRTGFQGHLSPYLARVVRRAREATGLPVAVGIGISTPDQAAAVARYADAVMVGSAVIRGMHAHGGARAAAAVAREFAEVLHRVPQPG